MGIKVHQNLIQGTDEWIAARCGLLTASEMKLILTPTLKIASNEKERTHLYELLAQRISGHVEMRYISDDMLRGQEDEIEAREYYARHYAPVEQVGFITNDKWGFTLGYSPDGLVGSDGAIECKGRRQKYQIQTVVEYALNHQIDPDFLFQCQTGLLVSERKWIDFVSFSAGLPMVTTRVFPDPAIQVAILTAAGAFEKRLAEARRQWEAAHHNKTMRMVPTERRQEMEVVI
jgi:hypothetical protein